MWGFTSEERNGPAGSDHVILRQTFCHPGEGAAAVLQLGGRGTDRDGWVLSGQNRQLQRNQTQHVHAHKHAHAHTCRDRTNQTQQHWLIQIWPKERILERKRKGRFFSSYLSVFVFKNHRNGPQDSTNTIRTLNFFLCYYVLDKNDPKNLKKVMISQHH